MDFFLLPLLLGAAITFVVCGLRAGQKRRLSFWPALFAALSTGGCVLLFSFGSLVLASLLSLPSALLFRDCIPVGERQRSGAEVFGALCLVRSRFPSAC